MNPDLVKAARAIVAALKQYPDLTEDEVNQIAKSYGQKGDDVVAHIQSLQDKNDVSVPFMQGVTANFADEISGLGHKLHIPGFPSTEEYRLKQDVSELNNPTASKAANLIGGAGSAIATGDVIPEIQAGGRVARAALNAGAVGGAYGAIAGAGEGESPADRVSHALTGAAAGTALGGVLGAGGARIAESTSIARALKLQLKTIDESGGMQALRKSLDDFRMAGRGADVMPADLSPEMQKLGSFSTQHDMPTSITAMKALDERQAGATGRVLNDVTDVTGQPLPDASGIRAQIPKVATTPEMTETADRIKQLLSAGEGSWSKLGVRDLEAKLAEMNPSDAEIFRYGLASKFVDMLRDKKVNRNIAKELFDSSIAAEEKLRVIFKTPQKFDEYMNRVAKERVFADTRSAAKEASHAESPELNPLSLAASAAFGPHYIMSSILHHIAGTTSRAETRKIASIIGPDMFAKGSAAVDAFLRKLSEPVNILGRRTTTSLGQAAGMVTNLFNQ